MSMLRQGRPTAPLIVQALKLGMTHPEMPDSERRRQLDVFPAAPTAARACPCRAVAARPPADAALSWLVLMLPAACPRVQAGRSGRSAFWWRTG